MVAKTGTLHHNAKLTEKTVREMREWYSEGGISILELAGEFDLCQSTARSAIVGETWKHVPPVTTVECGHCHGKGRVPK